MRKAFLRPATIVLAGALLSACVHAVDLVPIEGGAPGVGDVGVRGRTMKVHWAGKTYAGDIISGTTPQVAQGLAPAPGEPILASRTWGTQGVRGASGAVLVAKDGATITCRFDHDRSQMLGAGLCRGDDGRNFALRMR